MTTYSGILNLPYVAANQNQKETTINTALAILEAACNDQVAISLSLGNIALSTDQFTKYFNQVYSAQPYATTVTIPATKRFFCASNNGSYAVTLHCQGSSGTDLVIPAGSRVLVMSDGMNVVAVTSGVGALSDLSDTLNISSASSGQYLAFESGKWQPVDSVADVSFYVPGGVMSGSQKLYRYNFTRATRFLGDFSNSKATADTASTATASLIVNKNGTQVGTIVFTSSATATFTTTSDASVTFNAGDVMTIVAPSSPDATLAGVAATLYGVLI